MVSGILIAMAVVGAVGLFIGLFLGIAGIKFKVEVDEREEAVLSALPGNNCGGCGYPGCDGLAAAAVMRAVQIWRQQLPKGKRRSMPVRWAVSRLEKRSQRLWA